MRSGFGWRVHPITKKRTFHRGIDYGGTFEVLSAGDGKVVYVAADWATLSPAAKRRQSGGNVVIIQHATNCYTAYYHGAQQSKLKVGERVGKIDRIFRSGTTGLSTGPHLHFEVRTAQHSGHVDPIPYLNANSAPTASHNTVKVTGRLNKETWKAWQEELRDYGYHGIIDGIPGPMTNKAIQKWVCVRESGIMNDETRKAVQEKIGVKPDGIWGPVTVSAIQRGINDGTL
jgi:peptidoglycan hydrolase-like protein with peptidoglycan-binding domain